jgi:GNAT superfamily N-acetyltransferase
MSDVTIRHIDFQEAKARINELADILLDCVAGGASVSFMANMTREEALTFWSKAIKGVEAGQRILLVADVAGNLVGTVQVVASGIPNQPHRSDLSKMLVLRSARGKGIGAALLNAAENHSRDAGWWLMVLDTVTHSDGERLYRRGGWMPVGVIPNYALLPDGSLCPTTYFYKDLRPALQITVTQESPDQHDVIVLLETSDAAAAALYPSESNHMLDMAALLKPGLQFYVARREGRVLGCGALMAKGDGQGELKRFYVSDEARGAGVATALLRTIEDMAKRQNIRTLRLETGVYSYSALALYRKNGFSPCAAFLPNEPDPYSVFMTKDL